MLKSLRDFLSTLTPPSDAREPRTPHELQLATAVLLVEVMCADASLTDEERAHVLQTLRRRFALTDEEGSRLLEVAQVKARGAHDLHAFTSALNQQLAMEDKLTVVESMWQVAYADGHLAAHEQHILWRVADLLHVPHGAYIHAKMRARDGFSASMSTLEVPERPPAIRSPEVP